MINIPPKAKRIAKSLSIHGDTRIDNYYWLRDDTRSQPEVLDYLREENNYSQKIMESQRALQNTLFKEMISRIPQRDLSVPWTKNGYRYRHIYEPGNEYPIYQRQSVLDSGWDSWETLLDANQRAAQSAFYALGRISISPNNIIMGLTEDYLSRGQYDLCFRHLKSGNWYPEKLTNVSFDFVWANDSITVYYIKKHPTTLLPYQVWRHKVGMFSTDDKLIYEEKDETFSMSLCKTTSCRYISILLSSVTTTEVLLLDANQQDALPLCFLPREKGHEYSLDHFQDSFYLRSNREGKNFGLYKTKIYDKKKWEVLIPSRTNIVLEGFALFANWLVVEERQSGLISIRKINWETREIGSVTFDDPAYMTWIGFNPESKSSQLRYGYSSMTTPDTLFELDMNTGQRRVLKQAKIDGFDATHYCSEHLWIKARDGIEVPVSLVYHKAHFHRGKNPLLVYGYGSYGSSIEAAFSSSRLSLLDRGFIFAIAHVRGGGELGYHWHEDGKFLKKKNTFYDYLDVCNALLEKGYGSPSLCFGMGGSAGGMLMGTAINECPELFKGVIAQVPFVDVVTTMLDASIPLTTGEFEEWGNPKNAVFYRYMKEYSPYDNVGEKKYPHLLVTAGLYDSQVQYWEPAKWVAKLRELKTDENLLLLCTDMNAGHAGKSGRFKSYEEVALEYAFLIGLAQGTLPG